MGATTYFRATTALFALALAIGGAGLSFPLLQSLLVVAALVFVGSFVMQQVPALQGQFAVPVVALLAASIALPLLQLIPLPPELWTLLPGREQAGDLDLLIGWNLWRPWTLDVESTIRTTLILIPSAVLMVAFLRLGPSDRTRLLWLAVAVALVSAMLGIAQAASGGRFTPFPSAHSGFPIGLFVNRNHQAAMLLASMPIAAALGAIRSTTAHRSATVAITLSVIAIFAVTAIGTTSRMALVLLPVMLAVSLTLIFLGQSIVRMVLPSILGFIALVAVIWLGGGLTRNLARFSSLSDARYDYWNDVYWSLGNYSVAGTGIGTFVPVHKSAESLDTVTAAVLNHAHNDYIELLLEGGMAAVVLMGVFFAILAVAMVRKFRARESRESTLLATAAASAILSILLYSLVDYPLRMPSLAALFSLLVTFVLPSKRSQNDPGATPALPSWSNVRSVMRSGALLGVMAMAVVAVQAGVSARQLHARQPSAAARWAPWSTQAHSREATTALIADRDPQRAYQRARSALRLSPIDAASVRTQGVVAGLGGDQRKSVRLMTMSAVLGWRDVITQMWAIDTARRAKEPLKAVQRAEALYRQDIFLSPVTQSLLSPPIAGEAIGLLVRDLEKKPNWRRGFLRSFGQLTPAALPMARELVERLGRTAAPPSIDEAGPLLDLLSSSDQTDAGERLWRSLHSRALIDNGDFERTSDYRGPELPNDWDISNEDAANVGIDRPGLGNRGNALRLFQTRAGPPLIAQQMMLAAGHYRLRFVMRADKGSVAHFEWELRCLGTGANAPFPFRVPGDQTWHSITIDIDVPNVDCRIQRLALRRFGDTPPQAIWLDSVTLEGPHGRKSKLAEHWVP